MRRKEIDSLVSLISLYNINMRRSLALFLIPLSIISFAANNLKEELPQIWKKWLDEEVIYIITPKERDIFLSLKSEREREAFKQAFWLQRDPTQGTPTNEFKDEHYRRLKYVNEFYGRGTVKHGWETDRGRIYIILGEPVDIQRFYETSGNLTPTELWQYYGDTTLGVPPVFYIVFYQDLHIGDYKLYSPSFDGPQRLLHGISATRYDRYEAYMEIKKINNELAQASLSLIPGTEGDPSNQASSLSSDMLVANIHSIPKKNVKSEWAEAFARHSEIVSTDYSVNFVESNSVLFVHQEKGKYYLHTIIEPYRLSMKKYEDKVYAPLKLNTRISLPSGELVHQEEKNIPVELKPEDFKNIERRISAIGDIIPLVEKDIRIDLLLRNTDSKEFSSVEGTVASPPTDESSLSPILFLYDEKVVPEVKETTPFLFHGHMLYPNSQRIYSKKENLIFYFEIYNPLIQFKEGKLCITVSDEKKVWIESEEPVQNRTFFVKKIPLQDYVPGYYKISVTMIDPVGKEISKTSNEFIVSHLPYISRPWRFNKLYPLLSHGYFAIIRTYQYLKLGENDAAIREIAPFYDQVTPNKEVAKALAQAYFQKKEYSKVVEILDPLKNIQEYDIHELAGKAFFALKEYQSAIEHFKLVLSTAGEILEIINLIGYSYLEINDTKEAVNFFERSLIVNPNQPHIREIVNRIK